MRAVKTIRKSFSGVDVCARVSLAENLKPAVAARAANSEFATVKGADSDFGQVAACSDGGETVYFCGIKNGEEYAEPISCDGPYSVGSMGGRAVIFYSYRNRLYYRKQSNDGGLNYSSFVEIPQGEIVDLKLKALSDGIAVGVVLKYDGRYKFALSIWNGLPSRTQTLYTNNPTPFFAVTGISSRNLEITALGEYYQIFFYPQGPLVNFRSSVEGIKPKALATVEKDGVPYSYALYEKDGADYAARLKKTVSGNVFYMNDLCRFDGAKGLTASYSAGKTSLVVKTDAGIFRASFNDETKCDFLPVADAADMNFVFGSEEDACLVKADASGPTLLSNYGTGYNCATMPVFNGGETSRSCKGYCIEVEFRSKKGALLCGETVEVWSGSKLKVENGGKIYSLRKNKKTDICIGKTGNFVLRVETDSMTVPTVFVRLKSKMSEALAIDCADCVVDTMKSATAAELKNARCRDGYLLPDDLRNSPSRLKDFTAQLNALGNMPLRSGTSLPDAEDGGFVVVPQEYFVLSAEEGMIDIESVRERANSVGSFVVEFLEDKARRVYKFIVNTVNDIVNCAKLLFAKFKIKFEKLYEWLAYLFDWDDIELTALAAERIMKEGLPKTSVKIAEYKTVFVEKIKEMKVGFSETLAKVSQKTDGKSLFKLGLEIERKNPEYKIYAGGDSLTERAERELFSVAEVFPFPNGGNAADSPIETLKKFSRAAESDPDVKNMETSFVSQITDSDAVYSTPFSVLAAAFEKAVGFAVDGAAGIVGAVFDSFDSVSQAIISAGNAEITLPFISALYYEKFGERLTCFKLASLLFAIPLTASYKAITDEPPFKNRNEANAAADYVLRVLSGDSYAANGTKELRIFFTLASGIADAISCGLSAGVTIVDNPWASSMILLTDFVNGIGSYVLSALEGETDVFDHATFCLSVLFLLVDALVMLSERKYINNTEYGPILTCIMGLIDIVLSLATIIVREDYGADTIVAFVTQCLNCISKLFLIGHPGLKRKSVSIIMDGATGFISFVTAVINAAKISRKRIARTEV